MLRRLTDTDRVLAVMVDRHIGNAVVASPVIRSMLNALGERFLGLVVDARMVPLFERSPALAGAPLLAYRERVLRSVRERFRHFVELRRAMRATRPTVAIDLEGHQAGALLAWMSGARQRVGSAHSRRAAWYTARVPVLPGVHRSESYAHLARMLGIEVDSLQPRLEPQAADWVEWIAYKETAGLQQGRRFACMHVGGGRDMKCWPEERFLHLARWLEAQGMSTVLVGGQADVARGARVVARGPAGILNAAGALSLGGLVAGLSECAVFVGNDSGPAHMAAAVGAPVVALFGPTDPAEWAPRGASVAVIRGRTPLEPAVAVRWSPDGRRMDSIPVEEVMNAVIRIMPAARVRPACSS